MKSIVNKILLESEVIEDDFKSIPYFYHATSEDGFSAIMREGVKVNGGVYLADSFQNAAKFLLIRGVNPIYVIKISGKKLDKNLLSESFDHSESFFKCKAYVYDGDINPNKILMSQTKIFGK